MSRNALGPFGQQIARHRTAEVAQTKNADHPLALVDHRQSAHLKLLHVPHCLGEVIIIPAAMDARRHNIVRRRAAGIDRCAPSMRPTSSFLPFGDVQPGAVGGSRLCTSACSSSVRFSARRNCRLLAYFRQLYFLRAMPHVPMNEEPGFSLIRASPVRNAFGGQVIGSTARLRRRTSGSGSPLKSIK
jgi:hypothetical protein